MNHKIACDKNIHVLCIIYYIWAYLYYNSRTRDDIPWFFYLTISESDKCHQRYIINWQFISIIVILCLYNVIQFKKFQT